MEPFSTGAIFAGINSAFKFAEFGVRIAEVGTENAVFVRTIQVVRTDLTEAQRLLSCESIQKKLKCNPPKLEWIKSSINSTRNALFEIGKWVERARADQHATGTIRFETRVRWVFNDHEKLVNRQTELSACHQQLSNVLAYLTPLEELVVTSEKPPLDETTDFDDLISPRQRRQKSQQSGIADSYFAPSKEKHDMCHPQASAAQSRVDQPSHPQHTPFSGFGTMTTPCSPSSYPSSPPPTYASVIQTTPPPTSSWSYETLGDVKCQPYTNITKPSLSSTQATASFTCDTKSTEVYEYRDPRYGDQSKAFANNSWSLSGTNPLGPVDPLSMYAELAGPPVSSTPTTVTSNTTSVREVSELFGDLSFPAELPGSNTGIASSYQMPKSNTPLSRKPVGSSHYPMPYAGHSEASNIRYELPSPAVAIQQATSFGRSELPGCMSTSFRPASSVPLPDPRTTFSQTTSATSPQPSVPQAQSPLSTRMQRQKTYMDLLESLGTS